MSLHMKLVGSLSLGLLIAFGWHFATVFGLFGYVACLSANDPYADCQCNSCGRVYIRAN